MGGHSLNRLLPTALDATDESQRPLCQELVYGTLREWPYLTAICQGFLAKPLRRKDQDVMALLCVGMYELERLNTPAHAVVSETVNAARSLKKLVGYRRDQWRAAVFSARSHPRRHAVCCGAEGATDVAARPTHCGIR